MSLTPRSAAFAIWTSTSSCFFVATPTGVTSRTTNSVSAVDGKRERNGFVQYPLGVISPCCVCMDIPFLVPLEIWEKHGKNGFFFREGVILSELFSFEVISLWFERIKEKYNRTLNKKIPSVFEDREHECLMKSFE